MTVQPPPPIPADTAGYNYTTFTASEARGKSGAFRGVARVGEEAPDFSLATLQGEYVRLSGFRGQKHILLEFGAIT